MNNESASASNSGWFYDNPVCSEVEAKLRRLLVELENTGKIYGIQICAYKDGQVIIDTAAGVLGKDDPRPVQPHTLFPVFSITKGVVAGMQKLKLDENVANIWPEFGANGKDQIKVNHVLNHTSGLHNALHETVDDLALFCDWDACLKLLVTVAPETEPGREQIYHYLSYGWLCGGIIEHASEKKFQAILEEAFAQPLNVEGELYIGIPPGIDESRLASLTFDLSDLSNSNNRNSSIAPILPSTFTFEMITRLIPLFNRPDVRRAIIPASNGYFSARAVARYYAALVDGGVVPPRHPMSDHEVDTKIFKTPKTKLHDAFLGIGDYKDLTFTGGRFGLGFRRVTTADGSVIGFGHSGIGGSTAYCDINNRFAITVTVNKLSFGGLIGEIIRFVCSELDLPVPEEY